MSFNKIGFIGLGLIGGSIAQKLRMLYPDVKIYASARRAETVKTAYKMGIIDNDEPLAIEEYTDFDYIFLCAPVVSNIAYLTQLKDVIRDDTVITDVGSTKSEIHKEVIRLDMEKNFIGGHPMTGSEKTGIENANALLLENAYYIITPTEKVPQEKVDEFHGFVKALGSIPLVLDYDRHDYATASISHLPHMISFSLANLVRKIDDSNETMKTIAAGSFRDMTRVAASSPVMWENICASNKEHILELVDMYIDELSSLKEMITDYDADGLMGYFQSAKNYRDSLRIRTKHNATYQLFADLADETGGIAIVSGLLAFAGISIKNIGIVNNREFEEGVLHIEFYDKESLEKAEKVLSDKNYRIYKR